MTIEQHREVGCVCLRCVATDRLQALSDVFEHLGDYSAADCCNDWALRMTSRDLVATYMAAAIVWGQRPDGS